MIRLFITPLICTVFFAACKTKQKTAAYISPHTDTLKMKVFYTEDTLVLFVKKIIENDSLFNLRDELIDFEVISAEQKDSLMVLTIKSFSGCKKIDFDLYLSSLVLKTYPVRLRSRLGKTQENDCGEQLGVPTIFTAIFDIRGILSTHTEATLTFNESQTYATLKKK